MVETTESRPDPAVVRLVQKIAALPSYDLMGAMVIRWSDIAPLLNAYLDDPAFAHLKAASLRPTSRDSEVREALRDAGAYVASLGGDESAIVAAEIAAILDRSAFAASASEAAPTEEKP